MTIKPLILITLLYLMKSSSPVTPTLKEVMEYVRSITVPKITTQNIDVIGWDFTWKHDLVPSVTKYLFENITITENIAPAGNVNRPGDKHKKYYICVHDTGDATIPAKQWSQVVYDAKLNNNAYTASFQYVVGNDGYYHNIPDDETAYHAGDGHTELSIFKIFETNVYGNNKYPKISISDDGYYTIDGKKSIIEAPKKNGQILNEKYINDLGIYTTIKNGQYYIGSTWYSPSFDYIANRGGNMNSIGIESCIDKGTDVHLTWQRLAKLVAKLMDENDLGIDAVKQHHYFSGKNCPQTMRTAKRWEYFLDLVEVEYNMRQYMKLGFEFEFTSVTKKYVNEVGRVVYRDNKVPLKAKYRIRIKDKSGNQIEETFSSYIPVKGKN